MLFSLLYWTLNERLSPMLTQHLNIKLIQYLPWHPTFAWARACMNTALGRYSHMETVQASHLYSTCKVEIEQISQKLKQTITINIYANASWKYAHGPSSLML